VSGCSPNGTERSTARGAPLASQPGADCLCICVKGRDGERERETDRERDTSTTFKCKHMFQVFFPQGDLFSFFDSRFHLYLHRGHSSSLMCKQKQDEMSISWRRRLKPRLWNHSGTLPCSVWTWRLCLNIQRFFLEGRTIQRGSPLGWHQYAQPTICCTIIKKCSSQSGHFEMALFLRVWKGSLNCTIQFSLFV